MPCACGPAQELLHDRVGEAILDGLLGGHVEVAVGVLGDFFDLLLRSLGEDLVELGAQAFHLLGLDVDVHGGGLDAAHDERLVDHHAGVGKRRRLPFSLGAWRRIEPIEAAMPVTTTFTGEEIIRMVS